MSTAITPKTTQSIRHQIAQLDLYKVLISLWNFYKIRETQSMKIPYFISLSASEVTMAVNNIMGKLVLPIHSQSYQEEVMNDEPTAI